LESLQELKPLSYVEGEPREKEWVQFTEKLIIRAFGSDSVNKRNFLHAKTAGEYYMIPYGGVEDPSLTQRNYQTRIQECEGVLKSCLAELRLDLPEPEMQTVFQPGQEYEFYLSVKTILGFAAKEIFIIDPYLGAEIFDIYAGSIPRAVSFRLLTTGTNMPSAVLSLAQRYSSGGNLQFRGSNRIHDRVLFTDTRVWLCGQSLKDAAKKKPTYIIEHDEPIMRPIYEDIWASATALL
jgi:hypothetical protein